MEETTPPRKEAKRSRGTPTGYTPQQADKKKKVGRCARRSLEGSFVSMTNTRQYVPASTWSAEEIKALVEFILLHCEDKWPNHKFEQFWKSAATFVKERSGSVHLQTGNLDIWGNFG